MKFTNKNQIIFQQSDIAIFLYVVAILLSLGKRVLKSKSSPAMSRRERSNFLRRSVFYCFDPRERAVTQLTHPGNEANFSCRPMLTTFASMSNWNTGRMRNLSAACPIATKEQDI